MSARRVGPAQDRLASSPVQVASAVGAAELAVLEAVAAGRAQYGSTYPDMDRRAHAIAHRTGASCAIRPGYLLDGREVSRAERRTWCALASAGLIREAVETVTHHEVPARRVSVPTAAGPTTRIVPAHLEPVDPAWRCPVTLTHAGRAALTQARARAGAA